MTWFRVLLLFAAACVADGGVSLPPDAGLEKPPRVPHACIRPTVDDGFGRACTPDEHLIDTPCTSRLGEVGLCALDRCRRTCTPNVADGSGRCPEGQIAIPVVVNECYCLPCSSLAPALDRD